MSGRRPLFVLRFLDAIAALPWWLSAVLAVLAFVLLGRASGVADAAADGTSTILPQALHFAARAGQVLLPLLFLFGAASAIGQKLKGGAVVGSTGALAAGGGGAGDGAAGRPRAGVLSWSELESLVSDAYTRQGYSVERAGRGRGGVELILRRGRERFLVQCRHWQPGPIGTDAIRELEDILAAQSAQRGALVTPGDFTRDALELGRRIGIELIGGNELNRLASSGARLDTDHREPI